MAVDTSELAGSIGPEDARYDEARVVWNAMIDRRPVAIVRCTSTTDIVAAVRYARGHDLEVSVRGGGHGVAGNAVTDVGLMIDLSELRGVVVDPERRRVRAQGGATLADVDAATQEHGLATTLGAVSLTGIAGLTLGGGLGWLMRKHGLACDNLVAAEAVTASGEVVTASLDEHPELLWALRGGGGNFGVVTSFEYELHPVGPLVFGGLIAFPADRSREILEWFPGFVAGAPSDLGLNCILTVAPPLPFIPPEVQLTPIVALGLCWTGDHAEGERIVAPIRELGPALDMVGPIPYTALQQMFDEGYGPGSRSYWKSGYLDELTDGAVQALVEGAASRPPPPMGVVECQPLGGAFAARAGDSAFGNRDAAFLYNIVAFWQDSADDEAQIAWARGFFAAMEQHARGGAYVNYMTGEEGQDRVRAAFGEERYGRLAAIKAQYDPENVFHLNQNIVPSAG